MKNITHSNWFIIHLGVIAITGFCFTPTSADDFADDMDLQDGSFGQNYQYTWVPSYNFIPHSNATAYVMMYNAQYIRFEDWVPDGMM